MEDKQLICDLLLSALQATRELRDLKELEYHKDGPREIVAARFLSGREIDINVALDSGTAMVRDIMRCIG